MSLLYDKLAEAAVPVRPLQFGTAVTVCRLCDCDDDHPCIDRRGRRCAWVLLDLAAPTGICSVCAEEHGWHRFFMCAEPIAEDEAA